MNQRVDPGALLVAVFAVTVGPLADDGPWDRLNTVVAILLGIGAVAGVVYFALARRRTGQLRPHEV